jgi:drug/metabolite transporter (DMT)-like permease
VEKFINTDSQQTNAFWLATALVVANFFYGTNVIAVKYISPRLMDPFALTFTRLLVSAIVLLILPLFSKTKETIRGKDLQLVILAGLLGMTGNQLFSIKGISATNPIHASLLIMSTPIIVSLLAAIFLKEKFGWNRIGGLAMGLSGAILLIATRKQSTSAHAPTLTGDLFILGGSVCYSSYLVLIRSISQRYKPMTILRYAFAFGAAFSIPISYDEFLAIDWKQFDGYDWFSLAYIVITGTLLANILMNWGVMKWGPSRTGSFIYFQPFFGTAGAILLMNESLTIWKLIAGALIISGVWLNSLKIKTVS